jgi:hypothetical protein
MGIENHFIAIEAGYQLKKIIRGDITGFYKAILNGNSQGSYLGIGKMSWD